MAAKLTALTRDRVGAAVVPGRFPGGAALVDGTTGWVLPVGRAASGLGPALAWARRAEVDALHVVVEGGVAGVLARQALAFAPAPTVWRVEGPALVAAPPAALPAVAPPPFAPDLEARLVEAGLELVAGDGVLLGEVLGLEVARISIGDDGEPVLEVGVGRFDREVGEMTHGHLPPEERLARVVAIVTAHRRPGAPPHPLNQLVPERWLRSTLVAEPGLVGAGDLRPVRSAVGRDNLLEAGRATAVGTDAREVPSAPPTGSGAGAASMRSTGPAAGGTGPEGTSPVTSALSAAEAGRGGGGPVVVVCSTGIDLDLVPGAADDRVLHAPGARLVLAVPARDALPVTRALAARLAVPAEVVPVDGDWRIPWSS